MKKNKKVLLSLAGVAAVLAPISVAVVSCKQEAPEERLKKLESKFTEKILAIKDLSQEQKNQQIEMIKNQLSPLYQLLKENAGEIDVAEFNKQMDKIEKLLESLLAQV